MKTYLNKEKEELNKEMEKNIKSIDAKKV